MIYIYIVFLYFYIIYINIKKYTKKILKNIKIK